MGSWSVKHQPQRRQHGDSQQQRNESLEQRPHQKANSAVRRQDQRYPARGCAAIRRSRVSACNSKRMAAENKFPWDMPHIWIGEWSHAQNETKKLCNCTDRRCDRLWLRPALDEYRASPRSQRRGFSTKSLRPTISKSTSCKCRTWLSFLSSARPRGSPTSSLRAKTIALWTTKSVRLPLTTRCGARTAKRSGKLARSPCGSTWPNFSNALTHSEQAGYER